MFNIYQKYSDVQNDASAARICKVTDAFYKRIYHWYIESTEKLKDNDGFACLCIVFPICDLLSKFFYDNGRDKDIFIEFLKNNLIKDNISESNYLKLSTEKITYDYYYNKTWQTSTDDNIFAAIYQFRCGILHSGLLYDPNFGICPDVDMVDIILEDNSKKIAVNPWKFRTGIHETLKNYINEINAGTNNNLVSLFKKRFKDNYDIDIN